jgi:hypothetical protein
MMHDPMRLLDEGDPLEVLVLQSARRDSAPEHLRMKMLALGAGTAVVAGTTVAAAGTGTAAGSSAIGGVGLAKWAAVLVMAGVATASAGTLIVQPYMERHAARRGVETAPPSPKVAHPMSPAMRGMTAESVATPLPSEAVPSASAVRTLPQPSAAPARSAKLLEELSLLDSARTALEAGDTGLAIRQLDLHDLHYLGGQLAPDAMALRIEVYARRKDTPKVGQLAATFLARYPDHPEAPRIRQLVSATNP